MSAANPRRGYALHLSSVAVMAIAPVLNKFALETMSAISAALANALFGALLAYSYLKLRRRQLAPPHSGAIWLIGLSNGVGVALLYLSLALTEPVTVGFLGRAYVVFGVLLGAVVLNERLNANEAACVMLALVGMFAFAWRGPLVTAPLSIVAVLGYAFFFALTNLLIKRFGEGDTESILVYNNLIAALAIGGYALAAGEPVAFGTLDALGLVLAAAFLSSFLGLILFYEGLKNLSFAEANLLRASGPLFVALFSWPFFPVALSPLNVGGAALLLGGVSGLGYLKLQAAKLNERWRQRVCWGKLPARHQSVLVLLRHRGRWVLVKNPQRGWEFPGGHCEVGEHYQATARREAYEEAGAIIDALCYLGYYVLPNGHTTLVTLAEARRLAPLPPYETVAVGRFRRLPRRLSFGDGLYQYLLAHIERSGAATS